jgi:hypothetical protein
MIPHQILPHGLDSTIRFHNGGRGFTKAIAGPESDLFKKKKLLHKMNPKTSIFEKES